MKKPKKRSRHPGQTPSQLWYTPEQYELVKEAARLDGRSMTNFAEHAVLNAARKLLGGDQAASSNGHGSRRAV